MAADDPGSKLEEALKPEPEKSRKGLKMLLAGGLVLSGVVAIAVLAVIQSDAPSGDPVVVLKLPPQRDLTSPAGLSGKTSPMRKSIDSDDPDIKTVQNPEGERPQAPASGDRDAGGAAAPGALRRDTDAPSGMTKARITDPSGPADGRMKAIPRKLAALTERALRVRTPYGFVPVIGKNGRRPSEAYARLPDRRAGGRAAKARIALVLGGMGISAEGTNVAINRLPPDITLAFAPYGTGLQSLADKARRDGHEIMLQLPMEPFDYPDNDPGPKTMLTSLPPSENIKRLEWLMSRFSGFFGVTNYMGARFTTSQKALKPVMNWIGQHGLVYLDDGNSPRSQAGPTGQAVGLNVMRAHEVIDHGQTQASIKAALQRLETRALEDGLAIGIGTGLPLTVTLVNSWSKTLGKRGIVLVPVSSTFQNQKS